MNKKEFRKLNAHIDKEVLNLTGGVYPVGLITQQKPINHQKWAQEEILLNNSLVKRINAWVPEQERGKLFPGEKFNIEPEVVEFTENEITVDENWDYEETKYLFQELRHFNYNFIILYDRYQYQNKNRDIYQLKDRYYSVMREILQKRSQTSHQLYNYVYDEEYDRFRNMELEKYLKRTKQICDDEKKIQEDLRKLDQLIKKQEKEHRSITRCIGSAQETDEIDENRLQTILEVGQKNEDLKNKTQQHIVYLRTKWVNDVLPIPSSVKDKLDRQLKDIIPQAKLVLNQELEASYSQLRKFYLEVLIKQRLQKKREADKKQLEDKIRKIKAQFDSQPPSDIKQKK
ncbi:unnamed protein product (macronuclear) [Paramecium tetraurelia]|uniref:dAMP1 SANT/Myb-like domain-containing protein n=1 Tax=Paramecium tetraurelia TaxID=5888 RepID=A0D5J0_PARTE|nr:uncharacterized protein GSPATT00013737001 [Paramecium tetraurelia]CAK78307.1 unnamed protein product [Paramecium tetraurelia]|eukprot:XP_001445704.1 hypothetical protein (macronuclear) [Paramecium tetraurelia strain d4-2]